MAKNSLPPGFRFHPTDVELVVYYLKRKILGKRFHLEAIAEVDIYKYAPWDLPAKSCLRTGDLKWFFFCPREKKYANGDRMNRATEFGYWKTTGKDRSVNYNNETVGKIKTLVFHRGKAPKGERTDWVMHEYRLEDTSLADRDVAQDAYMLCIVFQKEGPGPRNGAQYGAPFHEEDWDDEEDVDCMEVASSIFLSTPLPNQINPVASSSHVPDPQCIATSESCLSEAIPSFHNVLSPIPENNGTSDEFPLDDLDRMLAIFVPSSLNENDQNENLGNVCNENVEPCPNGIDFFNDLGDLGNLGRLNDGVFANAEYNVDQMLLGDNGQFLELLDLDVPLSLPAGALETEFVHAGELYANQNCYGSEQSLFTVNPCLSQYPILPEQPYDFEEQLVAFLKGNGSYGNAEQASVNNCDATLLNPQLLGSTSSSEELRGGSHYPR